MSQSDDEDVSEYELHLGSEKFLAICAELNALVPDPGATTGFDGMSGGFRFSDEFSKDLRDSGLSLMIPTINLLRRLWGYRISVVFGAPRTDLVASWDATQAAAPNWPGFLPERRSAAMLPKAKECELASIRLNEGLDELDRQINAQSQFVTELRLQLDSDILEYGWILQVAGDCQVASDVIPVTITTAVYNAVAALLEEGAAEIGDAEDVGGYVTVHPWQGSFDERKSRLKEVIDRLGTTPEPGDGFWLIKPLEKEGAIETRSDVESFFARCARWLRLRESDV